MRVNTAQPQEVSIRLNRGPFRSMQHQMHHESAMYVQRNYISSIGVKQHSCISIGRQSTELQYHNMYLMVSLQFSVWKRNQGTHIQYHTLIFAQLLLLFIHMLGIQNAICSVGPRFRSILYRHICTQPPLFPSADFWGPKCHCQLTQGNLKSLLCHYMLQSHASFYAHDSSLCL